MTNAPTENAPRTPSFHRAIVYTSSGTILNIAALFIETILAARVLPEESYGIYVILIAVVNFLVVVVDFGCKTSVTKMLASADKAQQAVLANTTTVFRILVILAISALVWVWKDSLLIFDPDSTYLQYAVFVPLMLATGSFDELFFSMLQGFRSYGHIGISQVIRSVLRLGLSFTFLIVLHLGTVGLIYSWIISFGISSIYQFLALPISKRFVLQRPLLGEILRFGAPLQVTRFLWFLLRRVDILLLAAIAGPTSVAFYSVAARIPDALQRMSEAYIAVYFPTMSSMLATGKQKQATLILNRSVRLISLGTALGALVSMLFSSEIITLLFSHKYAASAPIFAILMLAFHVAFMLNLMGYTMTAAGQPGRSLWANLARVGLNVAGDLALIPYFGAVGAACAGLASAYIANPIAIWLTRKSGTIIEVASYSKQAVLLLLAGGVMLWSQPMHILYRAGILLLFVLLNVILGTVSVDDLNLVLPEAITGRINALLSRRNGEVVSHGN
jgi:O-antigen/teichoic acid export membrane protein